MIKFMSNIFSVDLFDAGAILAADGMAKNKEVLFFK